MMEKFSIADKRLKSRIDFGRRFDSLLDDVGLLCEVSIAQKAAEAKFSRSGWMIALVKKSGRLHLGRSFGSSR